MSYLFAVTCSGMLFMGGGWWLGWILTAVLALWLVSKYCRPVPVRVMSVIMWSMAVIFVGYSSYAAHPYPVECRHPDESELTGQCVRSCLIPQPRAVCGENPLLYGETLYPARRRSLRQLSTIRYNTPRDGRPIEVSIPHHTQVVEAGKPLLRKKE